MRVVFVGLGFGGLYALRQFVDRLPPAVRVVAVDRRDRFVFTPLLYEYVSGELAPDVVAPPYDLLVPAGVERVQAEVRALDVARRAVHLAGGRSLEFDVLVLAPGSVPAFHGVEGAESHAIPFYSFDDAARLRVALQVGEWASGGLPACVVGGGVVGVELAFALAELVERAAAGGGPAPAGVRVVVLEALPEILSGMSDGLRSLARRKLRERGVEVRTGVRVLGVDEHGVTFEERGRRERFDAAVVAWAAGIRPSPLLASLPAERHGRHGVRVEATLQLPGQPHVFVLGDAIAYPGRAAGEPLPDTAQAAVAQAAVCARNLRAYVRSGRAPARYVPTHLGDFLRIGRGAAIADVRGVVLDGRAAALARRAAYVYRLPAWALRTAALRQWLGLGPRRERPAPAREEERRRAA